MKTQNRKSLPVKIYREEQQNIKEILNTLSDGKSTGSLPGNKMEVLFEDEEHDHFLTKYPRSHATYQALYQHWTIRNKAGMIPDFIELETYNDIHILRESQDR